MAKLLKTLIRENGLETELDYFQMIIESFQKGNHNKTSELFQDLKNEDKERFLNVFLIWEVFPKLTRFCIKELLL